MSAGAIRMGRAFVELFADGSRLNKGLKAAEKDFKGWGSRMTGLGKSLSVGGSVGGVLGQVLNFASSPGGVLTGLGLASTAFASAGSELNDMSARTGASVESLSLLKFAAEQTGTEFSAVGIGLKGLDNKLADAAGGSKSAEAAFTKLGLSSQQLLGMSAEDQMAAIADGLQGIQNPALRAAAAQDVFGKAGMNLLPMLKDGAAGLKALTERGREVGAGWTTDAAQSADALGDRFDELKTTGMSVVFAIGGALAPAIVELSEPIFAITTQLRDWIAANPGVVQTVAMVAGGAVAAGTAIAGLGITLTMVGAGFGGLAAAAAAVVSPIGAVVAAVAGIGYLIVTETDIGSEAFAGLSSTATTTWGGITDAIASGDLGLAAEIAVAGLNVVWQQGVAIVLDSWTVATTAISQAWTDASAAMQSVGEGFFAYYQSLWIDIKGFAFDAMNAIAGKWDSVSGGLADVLIDIAYIGRGDEAGEIKAARREDTKRRKDTRDESGQKKLKSRTKEKIEIADNLETGLSNVETERAKKSRTLTDEQNAALMANEKAKVEAQEKLNELRKDAAGEAKIAAEFKKNGLGKDGNFKDQKEQLAYLKAMGFDVAGDTTTDLATDKVGGDVKGGASTFSGLASSLTRDYGSFASLKTPATSDTFGAISPGLSDSANAATDDPDTELLTSIRDTLQSLDSRVAAGGTMTA